MNELIGSSGRFLQEAYNSTVRKINKMTKVLANLPTVTLKQTVGKIAHVKNSKNGYNESDKLENHF